MKSSPFPAGLGRTPLLRMSLRVKVSKGAGALALSVVLLATFLSPIPAAAQQQQQSHLYADVLRAIGCLQEKDSPVRLDPAAAGGNSFRVRYAYGVEKISVGHGKYEDLKELRLLVYLDGGRKGYLFHVWRDPSETDGGLTFRDAITLETYNHRLTIVELWQGGMWVYGEEKKVLAAISNTPLRVIPRSSVPKPNGACWVPPYDEGRYGIRLDPSSGKVWINTYEDK
jgi:hypothetical protein